MVFSLGEKSVSMDLGDVFMMITGEKEWIGFPVGDSVFGLKLFLCRKNVLKLPICCVGMQL